jgi:hypothetical protein
VLVGSNYRAVDHQPTQYPHLPLKYNDHLPNAFLCPEEKTLWTFDHFARQDILDPFPLVIA